MHLIGLDKLGLLEPCAAKDHDKLKPRFRDDRKPRSGPEWIPG
jgi:hypothetical protein